MPSQPRRNPYPGIYRRGKTYTYYLDGPPRLETVTDPETGDPRVVEKRNQITKSGFPTAKAAWEARQQREAELSAGVNVNPSQATLAVYMRAWLDGRDGISDATWDVYNAHLQHRVQPYSIGSVTLQKLTPLHISIWLGELRAAGYAPRTMSVAFSVVKASLKQAADWGMVPRNVAASVKAPRIEPAQIATWSPAEMARFLAVSDADPDAPLWRLALLTGMRRGELLALAWGDIDLDRATLTVQRTLTTDRKRRSVIGTTTKTRASRRQIALPGTIAAQLKLHHDRQQFVRQKAGSLWVDQDLVFPNARGGRHCPSWANKRQHTLIEAAGVPTITFHGFRHTAATVALILGQHPRVVQQRLGHASIAMTLDLYSHVMPALAAQSIEDLDQFLHKLASQDQAKPKSAGE